MALLIVEAREERGNLVLRQDDHADFRALLAQCHAELDAGHIVIAQRKVEECHVEVDSPSFAEGFGRRRRRGDWLG